LQIVDEERVEIHVIGCFSRARLVLRVENKKGVWNLFAAREHFLKLIIFYNSLNAKYFNVVRQT
jgi:hypothetical protein